MAGQAKCLVLTLRSSLLRSHSPAASGAFSSPRGQVVIRAQYPGCVQMSPALTSGTSSPVVHGLHPLSSPQNDVSHGAGRRRALVTSPCAGSDVPVAPVVTGQQCRWYGHSYLMSVGPETQRGHCLSTRT